MNAKLITKKIVEDTDSMRPTGMTISCIAQRKNLFTVFNNNNTLFLQGNSISYIVVSRI